MTKQDQATLINEFLEWRLTKPYSDFQTREYDINEFLKESETKCRCGFCVKPKKDEKQ